MENLTSPMMGPRDGVLANALRPTTSLQMIAVEDIGFFAALAFARPQEFIGKAIELAGDSLTMPQVAETMTRVTGQPVQFVEVPLEQVAAFSQETADMLAWFNDHGYEADIAGLRKLHPGCSPLRRCCGRRTESSPIERIRDEQVSFGDRRDR